jgi:DMSO/TMAO reductase YedYZ molybdopterin-dependent catalytic subunit
MIGWLNMARGTAAEKAAGAVRGGLRAAAKRVHRAGAAVRRSAVAAREAAVAARDAAVRQPPGPFQPAFWRSPLRGPWLTSLLSLVLLAGLPVIAITGLLSYAAYNPRLHGNDETPGALLLKFFLFSWPTHPTWLYRVDQGVHVTLGLALLPFVLAKLWSVLPRLFSWPPVRSPSQALERLSLIMIVGGVLFEFATGILNIQDFYVFPFSFYTAHLYGAWVFIAGLIVHVALNFRKMMAGLHSRSLRRDLRTPLAATQPEAPDPEGLRAASPAPPTVSRRGMLIAVGGASLTLAALAVGQSIGGWTRRTALFAPRGLSAVAPGALPVNHTADAARITATDTGPAYRLVVTGRRTVSLTRHQLMALPQRTAVLPLACVEGWSYSAAWTGVPLAELARLIGITQPAAALVESMQQAGSFRRATLSAGQLRDPRSMLALCLNGVDLPPDHGYPARTIIPAAPGVHNTKWVNKITFVAAQ